MVGAKSGPGAFQLNGTPCISDTPVKPGDVITINSYRITIRDLPGGPPLAAPAGDESGAEQKTALGGAANSDSDKTVAVDLGLGRAKAPVSPRVGPKEKAADPQTEPPTTADPPPKAKPDAAGLSYLYLFFAPVKEFLMDDDVAEVMINGPQQIYVERKGKLAPVTARFANEQSLQAAVMNVARSVGRFFDKDNPRLDARLPDGSRVHAVMPPLSRAGTIVAIRKFRREKLTIQQLVNFGSISKEGAQLLDVIVKLGKNLIVSGATSSGKTSVLNVLSGLIPENERILVLEDASELQLQQPHKVCFETRKADEYGKGEVTIRDLLHSALRLRPDRIVVGEIRSGEALDLLQAMNTGHEGSMSTIHANNARDSLLRMETCALLSGVNIPLSALREQVASAIQVVLQTARLHDGTRKITGITEVLGLKNGEYQYQDIYLFKSEGQSEDGKILGRHVFTGYQPTFLEAARHSRLNLDGLFT
jgi:pilus assembly protein CpaF